MEDGQIRRLPLRENLTGQGIILVTLALLALGVVMIHSTSATFSSKTAWYNRPDARQAMYAPAALLILCTLWRADYRRLARRPWAGRGILGAIPSPATMFLILGLILSLVVLIPGVGHEVGGQRRWLKAGPVQLQPSEVLKFALLVFVAAYLSRPDMDAKSFTRAFLPLGLLTGVAALLVVKYNFSTAAVMGVAAVGLMLVGGVRWYYLGVLIPLAVGAYYGFVVYDPHRSLRMAAFLDPFSATNPSAYQPGQSLIWISSGANPPGLGAGVAKYGYLPEDDTDFIFTTICHETGILGAILVIALLLVWLWLARRAAARAPDRFGTLLAAGAGFAIILQAALHIAVTLVWAPPTGISLPFVSVGGTALLIMSAVTAMIISVTARRRVGT